MARACIFAGVFLLIALHPVRAQTPSGTIAGVVTDPDGRAISGVKVSVINQHTDLRRTLRTSDDGSYSGSALQPGVYQITAEADGFQRMERVATVEVGATTAVDLSLQLGSPTETVTVEGVSPQLHHDAHEVSGVVTRTQIDSLPLNGRSFLELVKLEPGAQAPTPASNNRMLVPLLGAPGGQNGRGTRVTVDGGSILQIGNGGSAMGFSQEVVQEFQISTAGFELATGVTAAGAVNVVTRSGGNQFHGSGFYFFRDHTLSAYPLLARDPLDPDPFFQRRQFGTDVGGPIRKERAFFLTTFERNRQRGVSATTILTPEFASFGTVTPSPTDVDQFSARVDIRLTDQHFVFLRQSHEGISSFAPTTTSATGPSALPSGWTRQPAWTDQSLLGLTSQFTPRLANDLRFSYFFVSSAEQQPSATDCPGCLGIGAPAISVNPDLFLGESTNASVLGRRYHINDIVSWQASPHRARFGGEWEVMRGGRRDTSNEPVSMTLFSPANVRNYNASQPATEQIPLPASFRTLQDILELPLQSFNVGIGNSRVPQADFGNTRVWPTAHLFFQDTWRLHSKVTMNYGLAWTYDGALNYDLHKPAYLASFLGADGLGPTRRNWTNFSPMLGLAWSPGADGKTVVHAGAGIYYDLQSLLVFGLSDPERVSLGPRGVGRFNYPSSAVANPLVGIPGVYPGTPLNFRNPTLFTGATLLDALPAIRAALAQMRGDPNNRDFSVSNIQVDKTGTAVPENHPAAYATHLNVGVQREVLSDLVITVDFVNRQFVHSTGGLDLNRYNSVRQVLPTCTAAGRGDPRALCSLGPITIETPFGRARYRGMLVRADKRFSGRLQFLASYAYSSDVGNNGGHGFNNDNWFENYGPLLDRDFRHILNLSGIVQLPSRFQLALSVTYNSKPPFSAFLGSTSTGNDLNGDGTYGDLLPGTHAGQFNRALGKDDLVRLVNEFNQNYAGKTDAAGRPLHTITLPASYEFGDPLLTHDLRVSRVFPFGARWRLTLIGDVFNLLNISNLSGRSGDLTSPGFGQPTSRVTQVFGSGGPRAFQLALRAGF